LGWDNVCIYLSRKRKEARKVADKTTTVHKQGSNVVVVKETEKKVDVYVTGQGEEKHDHLWVEKDTGKSGTEHRGQCDQCSDDDD